MTFLRKKLAVSVLLIVAMSQSMAFSIPKFEQLSRRDALATGFGFSTLMFNSQATLAAEGPTKEELDRIKQGYDVSSV